MGYEYTHSYRTLLHLADTLAREGLPALRFDFYGTGTSPGDALSPQLLTTWVDDVHAAARFLEETTGGVSSLLGLRLGATLAALAASRAPVAQLVAWAPVVSGRQYAREHELIGKTAGSTRVEGAGYFEAGGFILSDETGADLRAVDLAKLTYNVEGEVLLLERDDLKPSSKLSDALTAQGIPVDVVTADGYAEMMDEPHSTTVPRAALSLIASWLRARADIRDEAPCPQPARRASVTLRSPSGDQRREELIQISASPSLFGVLTAPETPSAVPSPLLVLTNAGSVHHVGPNRVYVELARALAEEGFSTLRLDLRNLGDSIRGSPQEENHPYPRTALEDVALALEWSRRERGYEHAVVGGICSGAHTAFHSNLELAHESLRGALVVNPLTFQWKEGLSLQMPPAYQTIRDARHYTEAARDPQKWLKLIRGQADVGYIFRFMVRRAGALVAGGTRDVLERLSLKPLDPLARHVLACRGSGRRLDFVFSRSDPGYGILMSRARKTVRSLTRTGEVSVRFVEQSDHTFSRREWREELARVLVERMRYYAGGAAAN